MINTYYLVNTLESTQISPPINLLLVRHIQGDRRDLGCDLDASPLGYFYPAPSLTPSLLLHEGGQ